MTTMKTQRVGSIGSFFYKAFPYDMTSRLSFILGSDSFDVVLALNLLIMITSRMTKSKYEFRVMPFRARVSAMIAPCITGYT